MIFAPAGSVVPSTVTGSATFPTCFFHLSAVSSLGMGMVIGNCPFPDRFGPWVAPGLSAYRGPSIHMFDSCSAPARPDLVGQPCAAPRRAEPFDKGEVGGFAVDVEIQRGVL